MLDFSKMYCNRHSHELITNFCNKDECLIGLCANCICTHTQHHIQKGTNPGYENIRDTYKNIQNTIHSQIELFQNDKQRLQNIKIKTQEKRLKIRSIIDSAKQQVLTVLGTYFDEKEKKMVLQIQTQEKKYGLHCLNRLDSLNSYISREVSCLLTASQQVTSNNFLQSLPRVRTQCLANAQKIHSQLVHEIQLNEKFNTYISFKKQVVSDLPNIMEQAIKLQFDGMSYNSILKKQEVSTRRAVSQDKITLQNTYNESTNPHFGSLQKVKSQIIINPSLTYLKNKEQQYHQNQHLKEILGFQNSIKKQYEPSARISVGVNKCNRLSEGNTNPRNSVPNLHGCLNRQNSITQNKVVIISGQQKMIPNKNRNRFLHDRNLNSGHYNESIAQPLFTPNIQIIPPSKQKIMVAGMGKKYKKSGIKIFTPNQIQPGEFQKQNSGKNLLYGYNPNRYR